MAAWQFFPANPWHLLVGTGVDRDLPRLVLLRHAAQNIIAYPLEILRQPIAASEHQSRGDDALSGVTAQSREGPDQ